MFIVNKVDKGFVSWQGERLFVPWFGPIRIVPSAESEVSILKLRERAHGAMALAFLPLFFVGLGLAVWTGIGTDHSVLTVMIGLVAIFGVCGLIERKRTRDWPIY